MFVIGSHLYYVLKVTMKNLNYQLITSSNYVFCLSQKYKAAKYRWDETRVQVNLIVSYNKFYYQSEMDRNVGQHVSIDFFVPTYSYPCR